LAVSFFVCNFAPDNNSCSMEKRIVKNQEEIDDHEVEALKLANEGYSTKNRPEAENRGYGISTSKEMLVVGMKGAFFMMSGGAFHRYENGANDYIDLKDLFNWKGTVILMRIPVNLPEDFNYIDYLE